MNGGGGGGGRGGVFVFFFFFFPAPPPLLENAVERLRSQAKGPPMKLVSDDELERSGVVANCRMNRERDLLGSNGYDRELGFNPLDFLKERLAHGGSATWLDLCCGTGKALIQAAKLVHAGEPALHVEIVGVDLVGMFHRPEPGTTCLRLVEASLTSLRPDRSFDLITCVHGLHYVGDKLGLIARAASWLIDDGLFVANLDLANLKLPDGRAAGRRGRVRPGASGRSL